MCHFDIFGYAWPHLTDRNFARRLKRRDEDREQRRARSKLLTSLVTAEENRIKRRLWTHVKGARPAAVDISLAPTVLFVRLHLLLLPPKLPQVLSETFRGPTEKRPCKKKKKWNLLSRPSQWLREQYCLPLFPRSLTSDILIWGCFAFRALLGRLFAMCKIHAMVRVGWRRGSGWKIEGKKKKPRKNDTGPDGTYLRACLTAVTTAGKLPDAERWKIGESVSRSGDRKNYIVAGRRRREVSRSAVGRAHKDRAKRLITRAATIAPTTKTHVSWGICAGGGGGGSWENRAGRGRRRDVRPGRRAGSNRRARRPVHERRKR